MVPEDKKELTCKFGECQKRFTPPLSVPNYIYAQLRRRKIDTQSEKSNLYM